MANKVVQRHTRESNIIPASKIQQEEVKKVVVQKLKRELPKIPSFSTPIPQLRAFAASTAYDYYLGFGGLGDALLLLATCWDNPKAKVIFFANQQSFVRDFFALFNIPAFLHDNLMGTPLANQVYNFITKLPTFKESAHLADGLDYGDWINESKYVARIRSHANWTNKIGKRSSAKPILILAPSGSSRDVERQRYISVEEYRAIVNKYLNQNYKVYATGSLGDLHFFGLIDHKDFHWLNSETLYHGNGHKESINLKGMLQIINSANLVISADTWLKTYSLICDIPTIVIQTRWNNAYKSYGEDITDFIFLNNKIWPNIRMTPVTELL
jgi:hypothetical protein